MTQAQSSKYALQLTPRRILGWGLLAFFLLAWMFVLGVLVGRGTIVIPSKSQALNNELADLKEKALAAEREKIEAQAKEVQEKAGQLGFYKALKEVPPPPQVQLRPTPTQTPVKPKATPAKPKTESPAATPVAVPKTASTPQPAEKAEASAAVSKSLPKPPTEEGGVGKARYTIQVAAFRDLESAARMVAALRAKGYAAYQVHTGAESKEAWFRVRVGAFENRNAADSILKKLQAEKYNAVVVGAN